jgi:hypothetical protein
MVGITYEGQCGPQFKVEDAPWDMMGWKITHRRTGHFIFTGGYMTMREACEKLEQDFYELATLD